MSDDPTAGDPYRNDPYRGGANPYGANQYGGAYRGGQPDGSYPGYPPPGMGDTAPIPVVNEDDPDPDDKRPSRIPTILVTLFLGPFGAIAAAVSAGRAHDRGFPRATYWLSFIFTWAVHLLIITALVVAWLLGAFDGVLKSSSTPSPSSSPVASATPTPSATATPTPTTTSAAPTATSARPSASATASASATPSGVSNLADFPAGAAKMCGASIAANSATTCDFATAVADAYLRSGSFGQAATVQATSSTTGQTYTMNCNMDARAITTCTGGNGASVYMR
ncbi:hypothetical protein [Propionibacterium freudenreichii]|uniref:hypothetical protein n=1 Tax=Propionibacterium freudenreichii TaxID=1744 RepID=UPI000542D92F|nr:hypothetical protein [Propionibacterium freudenreichii]AJQ90174.1 Hypothetical protein RM25_0442 [Propionibacterium freudenreichii subsp. freudenreichii]MCT2975022.1 hypothetical protein [Propionibacterium freudenreichii]MCT2978333.1 hypothetical protein [Propionibacterium freudenreichii]MCT2980072.1 hypothetical protein [Propionibacterium freudenreichii]MCT2984723.1 hypothetical protein [Propionibacterium freudenreichii]